MTLGVRAAAECSSALGPRSVRWRDGETPELPAPEPFTRVDLGYRHAYGGIDGRAIAANAGVLLTRVEFLKPSAHKNFAVVDAAMNDLIRPSLYSAWMDIVAVTPRDEERLPYDIVGPVCETGDFLGKERKLALRSGDLLSVMGAGAYGFVMSSNYNTRGRAAEILVDGEQAFTVRRRETVADLLALESLLP